MTHARIKPPRILGGWGAATKRKRQDPLKPGRHTAKRQRHTPDPPETAKADLRGPSSRTRVKKADGNARQEIERRGGGKPLGARETPRGDQAPKHGTRNYPPRPANLRQKDTLANTRQQLASRGAAAKPHPSSGELARTTRGRQRAGSGANPRAELATRPGGIAHPMSGELARPNTVGRGVAKRPAARIPTAAKTAQDPVPRDLRHPETHGKTFAGSYFGSWAR